MLFMLETSARLLRLLSLLQLRATWTGEELVERLEITPRTLRRDMDRLRDLGYPVTSTSGRAGGYSLGAGASMPPLMLDDEEGLAIALGLTSASFGGSKSLANAAQRAQAKLEQVMPPRVRKRFESAKRAIVRAPDRISGPTDSVSRLIEAVNEHRTVHFQYRDYHGKHSERRVEPQRLVLLEAHWYLLCWDLVRNDWRSFRVERMRDVALGEPFTPRAPPHEDVAAFVARGVQSFNTRVTAVLLLNAPYSQLRARFDLNYGELEAVDDETTRWTLQAGSLDGVAMWVSMLDMSFVVQSPPELRERLCVLSDRLRRAAEGKAPI
jgi:predicted DNA-binding transcriptional regulator YafY